MAVYWYLISLAILPALNERLRRSPAGGFVRSRLGSTWLAMSILLALIIGFRYKVGGDWYNYSRHIDKIRGNTLDLNFVFDGNDPGYQVLSWIGANIGGGIFFPNFVCACIFTLGLTRFAKTTPRPWLAIMVAMPYLITVVSMGYTRQGVAIGLVMAALADLTKLGSIFRFLFWMILATLFHKTAVILIPLALFTKDRTPIFMVFSVLLITGLLFVLLLKEAVDSFIQHYIMDEYQSSGAAIRIAMNAFPAFVILIFRKRFISRGVNGVRIWIWVAWGALACIILLMISPSTTAVDRIALYFIPLQIFVFSHIPDVLGKRGQLNMVWVIPIVIYSLSVLYVWLFWAKHAYAWVPYQFYLWTIL